MMAATWKFQISTVLRLRGLIEIVDGTDKCLVLIINADKVVNLLEINDWNYQNIEAKAQLILILKDKLSSDVLHTTLATNVWDKLNECYEEKCYNTVAYLIKEIFHISFSDEMLIEPQLNNVCHKTYILKMFSEPISNAVITYAMSLTLPESYSTLHTILNFSLTTTSSLSPFIDTVITQVLTKKKNAELGCSDNSFYSYKG